MLSSKRDISRGRPVNLDLGNDRDSYNNLTKRGSRRSPADSQCESSLGSAAVAVCTRENGVSRKQIDPEHVFFDRNIYRAIVTIPSRLKKKRI